MSLLNKFDNIKMDNSSKEDIKHLNAGINKEDYEYCLHIENIYNTITNMVAEFRKNVNDKVREFHSSEELERWNKDQFYYPTVAKFADYGILENNIKYANDIFIYEILNYFQCKYKTINYTHLRIPNLEIIDKGEKDKLTYLDVLNYIQTQYSWTPPQQ